MDKPDAGIFEQRSAAAKADAATMQRDADLAAAVGDTPEHRAARERVARLYCKIHLPDLTPQAVESYLATVELAQPVQVVNIAGVSEADSASSRASWGFGHAATSTFAATRLSPPSRTTRFSRSRARWRQRSSRVSRLSRVSKGV